MCTAINVCALDGRDGCLDTVGASTSSKTSTASSREPQSAGNVRFVMDQPSLAQGTDVTVDGTVRHPDPYPDLPDGRGIALLGPEIVNGSEDQGLSLPSLARPQNHLLALSIPATARIATSESLYLSG